VIAVVHLVWGPLGGGPLRRFLESYGAHRAGVEHELITVLNGVDGDQRSALVAELDRVAHRAIELKLPVQDLAAYAQAVARLEHERVCFLNSHSEIVVDDWLAKLDQALDEPRAGLVGATGSWASLRSYAFRRLGLPSAYRPLWPDRSRTFKEFQEIESERSGSPPPRGPRTAVYTARTLADMAFGFPRFPAPHVRTNAFMAERSFFDRSLARMPSGKFAAYRLESGHRSITTQVRRSGLRALVVDSEGAALDTHEWPHSETFWSGAQRRLLVADNQTRIYQEADGYRRTLLAQYAWGARAAPSADLS
jgi:hypothetical protein